MDLEEKRKRVAEYCGQTDCAKCVLNTGDWMYVEDNKIHSCPRIRDASEKQLDRAIGLIDCTAVSDNVDHPEHYQGAHECIDVMRSMFGDEAVKSFCRCNAYKYRFRADRKNGVEDIKKAEFYETYLINLEKGNEYEK